MQTFTVYGSPKCDFCNVEGVGTTYESTPFTLETLGTPTNPDMSFSAEWNACKECASLIDAEDWDALTDRSLSLFMEGCPMNEEGREMLRGELKLLHRNFAKGLKGKKEKASEVSRTQLHIYSPEEEAKKGGKA